MEFFHQSLCFLHRPSKCQSELKPPRPPKGVFLTADARKRQRINRTHVHNSKKRRLLRAPFKRNSISFFRQKRISVAINQSWSNLVFKGKCINRGFSPSQTGTRKVREWQSYFFSCCDSSQSKEDFVCLATAAPTCLRRSSGFSHFYGKKIILRRLISAEAFRAP